MLRIIYSIASKGMGAGSALLFNLIVARLAPPSEVGIIFYSLVTGQLLSILAKSGLDTLALRQMSGYAISQDYRVARDFHKKAILLASIFSVPTCLIGGIWVYFSTSAANSVSHSFLIICALVPSISISYISAESLKGVGRINSGLFWQTLFQPLLLVLLVAIIQPGFVGISYLLVFSFAATAILSSMDLIRILGHSPKDIADQAPAESLKQITLNGLPFLVIAITNGIIDLSDTVLLGFFVDSQHTAIYYICAKLAATSTMALFLINSFAAPKIVAFHRLGDTFNLHHTIQQLQKGMIAISAVLFIVFFFFGNQVLSLFGETYSEQGSYVLQILSIGYLSVLVFGPTGIFMTMTGRQAMYMKTNMVACALNLILNLSLIPIYGIKGACVGTAVSLVTKNAFLFYCYVKIKNEKPA